MNFEKQVESLTTKFGQELISMVREGLSSEIDEIIGGNGHAKRARNGNGNGHAKAKRKTGPRHVPKQCLKPGCKKPNTGPRFSFLCVDHRDKASKKDKRAWHEAWAKKQAS